MDPKRGKMTPTVSRNLVSSGWLGKMLPMVLRHLRSSAWLYLTPVLAACVSIGAPRAYLERILRRLLPIFNPYITLDIASKRDDYYMDRVKSVDTYDEVKAYLSAACSRKARQLRAESAEEGSGFVISLREGPDEVADEFRGVTMWWSAVPEGNLHWQKCCRLTFHQRHRKLVVDEYLPHMRRCGREAMSTNRRRRLYTNKKYINYFVSRKDVWSYIDFDHPTVGFKPCLPARPTPGRMFPESTPASTCTEGTLGGLRGVPCAVHMGWLFLHVLAKKVLTQDVCSSRKPALSAMPEREI